MADVTNQDPVVTESKLKDFYEDIKPYLGCPAYITQEGDEEYYSTDEKVVGRWVNNKPLYQRSFYVGQRMSWRTGSIDRGDLTITKPSWFSDVEDIVETTIQGDYGNGAKSTSGGETLYIPSSNTLSFYGSDNVYVTYVTIKYTKQSDSAITTVEQKPTHYSTDEQVIGTWINGKPVYQKVLVVESTVSRNGWIPFNNNIDVLIEYGGMGYYRTQRYARPFPWDVEGNYANINSWNSTGLEYSTNSDINILMSGSVIWLRYTKTTD